MVKWIKFGKGTNNVYKVDEREYNLLKERGENLTIVKSKTRNRVNSNPWLR